MEKDWILLEDGIKILFPTQNEEPQGKINVGNSGDIYDKFCQGENVDFPSLFKDILQKRLMTHCFIL